MKLVKLIYSIIVCLLIISFSKPQKKHYKRNYNENGILTSEGWTIFKVRTNYWKFYHPNGKLAKQGYYTNGEKERYWFFYDEYQVKTKEGPYKNNQKVGWWLFYDNKGTINHKCQLKNGVKNGYCLKYMDEKLISAEKYSNGKKIKEWKNFSDFTQENSLSDLKYND